MYTMVRYVFIYMLVPSTNVTVAGPMAKMSKIGTLNEHSKHFLTQPPFTK